MSELKRIDPNGCGCTDCITGYSKPLDECSSGDLLLLVTGVLQNASGHEPEVSIDGRSIVSLAGLQSIRNYFFSQPTTSDQETVQ